MPGNRQRRRTDYQIPPDPPQSSTRINNLEHKRQSVLAFIENEENQKSFRLIKRQLMRVLRHIFPRKLSGQFTFGVEDPYLMGQILSVHGKVIHSTIANGLVKSFDLTEALKVPGC